MRVLFNTTAALEGTSGFTQTIQLVRALTQLNTGHKYVVLTTVAQAALRDAVGTDAEHLTIARIPSGGLLRTVSLWATLPALVRRTGADVLYNRGNFYAPRIGCPQVCLIENANPYSNLQLPAPIGARIRNRLLRATSEAALRNAAAVIFPSDTARRRIVNDRPVRSRTYVIHHGADMPHADHAARPLAAPYVLVVSSVLPYKNLSIAVRTLALLRQQQIFTGHLVIIGDQGRRDYRHQIERDIRALGLESAVHIRSAVPRVELSAWYRHSALLLMTSLEETFGLPVVEAMVLGTPVVASALAPPAGDGYFLPFRELAGDAAEYFNPFDPADCAQAVARALAPSRRAAMIGAGFNKAREYSWSAAAVQTAHVIDAAAGRSVTAASGASRNCSDIATHGTRERAP